MDPNISSMESSSCSENSGNAVVLPEKELRKIAARIAADNGVEVMFFL